MSNPLDLSRTLRRARDLQLSAKHGEAASIYDAIADLSTLPPNDLLAAARCYEHLRKFERSGYVMTFLSGALSGEAAANVALDGLEQMSWRASRMNQSLLLYVHAVERAGRLPTAEKLRVVAAKWLMLSRGADAARAGQVNGALEHGRDTEAVLNRETNRVLLQP